MDSKWYSETLSEGLKLCYRVDKTLYEGKSEYQDIEFVDTKPYGKVLLLDGNMQSSESDEFIYHELLVVPALVHHKNPKNILIMGGGEGATAREVLRFNEVESCIMVDIDGEVCDACRKNLPINAQIYDDPRFHLYIDDAKSWLEKTDKRFDVIISDLPEPVYDGPCYKLYTKDFYKNAIYEKLNPGGIFVTQSGSCEWSCAGQIFTILHNTLKNVFPVVIPYGDYIPSFIDIWGWNMVFKEDTDIKILNPENFDYQLHKKINTPLQYIDGDTWLGMQKFNKRLKSLLNQETKIYDIDSPPLNFNWQVCQD